MSQKTLGFMAASLYGQWICHSPKPMKTDILRQRTAVRVLNRLGGVSDLIRAQYTEGKGLIQFIEIRCRRFASRYPESIIRRSAIFLAIAA